MLARGTSRTEHESFATCQIAVVVSRARRGVGPRHIGPTDKYVIPMRIARRVAVISLALLGTMAWNGFLIFIVGRMIQLW